METPHVGEPSAETSVWNPSLPAAPGFSHDVVETPGLRTHVATIGDGPPVVLLHGLPQHWWQWRDVAPVLAAQGFRVICPDLRGAGWTEAADPGIRHLTRMHDLIAVLDVLGVDRAHVMTHDLGALTGMHLAYSHPDRVRTLVQLSVPPGFMRFTLRLMPAFRHYPRLLWGGHRRSLRWLLGPPYAVQPMAEETVEAYLRVEARPEVARATRKVLLGMIGPELPWLLGRHYKRMRLRPPMLVAFGRHDPPFSERMVRGICRDHERRAERFELAFVQDAGHFVVDDAPDAVAALALDWFGREGGRD